MAGLNWHRKTHKGQISVVDPGHTLFFFCPFSPSRAKPSEGPHAWAPRLLASPLLSGSDPAGERSPKSFDVQSRSSGAHGRWSLPAEGRRFDDPVSSPPGRFRWPGCQRLALAFCGSVTLRKESTIKGPRKSGTTAISMLSAGRTALHVYVHREDVSGEDDCPWPMRP